jgi:hypothetical protein
VPEGRADRDGLNQIAVVAACEMNRTVGHPFWVVGCGVLRWLVWREPKVCHGWMLIGQVCVGWVDKNLTCNEIESGQKLHPHQLDKFHTHTHAHQISVAHRMPAGL